MQLFSNENLCPTSTVSRRANSSLILNLALVSFNIDFLVTNSCSTARVMAWEWAACAVAWDCSFLGSLCGSLLCRILGTRQRSCLLKNDTVWFRIAGNNCGKFNFADYGMGIPKKFRPQYFFSFARARVHRGAKKLLSCCYCFIFRHAQAYLFWAIFGARETVREANKQVACLANEAEEAGRHCMKRPKTSHYSSPEDHVCIGKYAAEHGYAKAIRHFLSCAVYYL